MTNNSEKLTVSACINGVERYCTSRYAVGDRVRITKNGGRKGEVVTVASIRGSFGHSASATFTYICDPYQGGSFVEWDLAPTKEEN